MTFFSHLKWFKTFCSSHFLCATLLFLLSFDFTALEVICLSSPWPLLLAQRDTGSLFWRTVSQGCPPYTAPEVCCSCNLPLLLKPPAVQRYQPGHPQLTPNPSKQWPSISPSWTHSLLPVVKWVCGSVTHILQLHSI